MYVDVPMEALRTFIPRIYQNYNIDTILDVKAALYRAVVTLFTQQCRNVDPQYECVAAPVYPKTDFGVGGKFVDVVQANAYQSDEWVVSIEPGVTDILAVRLKPNAAVAIAGFAVETDDVLRSRLPITRLIVYQDLAKQKPVRTLNMLLSVAPMDYPLAYALFPEPIVVAPGNELVIETVTDARLASAQQYVIKWLPPIVLTSRRHIRHI